MSTSHSTVSSAARRQRIDDVNPLLWVVLSLLWVGILMGAALGQYAMTLLVIIVGVVACVFLAVPALVNVQTTCASMSRARRCAAPARSSRDEQEQDDYNRCSQFWSWSLDSHDPMSIWYDPD